MSTLSPSATSFSASVEHNIKFFDENYVYVLPDDKGLDFKFATRSELYRTISNLKGEIIENQKLMLKSVKTEEMSEQAEKVNEICDKIVEIIEKGNDFYCFIDLLKSFFFVL